MSSELPKPNQEREALLANAPLTKHYLTILPTHNEAELDAWMQEFSVLENNVENSLIERFGENWQQLAMGVLLVTVNPKKHLHPALTYDQTYEGTKELLLVGYEIGLYGIDTMLPEILSVLNRENMFNPQLTTRKGSKKLADLCVKILKVGGYLKDVRTIEETNRELALYDEKKGSTNNNAFADFINNNKKINLDDFKT